MKKVVFLALTFLSNYGYTEMIEVNQGPRNKHIQQSQSESVPEPQVDYTQEQNKRFYQTLFKKIQKANPTWSKEEVTSYIEPLWYKKLEIDKENKNRRRPSLSNEDNIKKTAD